MTNSSNEYIKQQLAQYRAMRALNLIRALGFTVVGIAGIVVAVSGSLFDTTNGATPRGWLYENLGKDGAQAAAIGLMVLVTAIGVIWSYRVIRDLTSGYKKYEAQLKQEVQRGIEYR